MLTIDDANTIMEKYGKSGFWYKIDLTLLNDNPAGLDYDFVKIRDNGAYGYKIIICNSLFYGLHYFSANGNVHSQQLFKLSDPYTYSFSMDWGVNPDTLWVYLTADNAGQLDSSFNPLSHLIIPLSNLQIPVINGVFDDKFYINVKGGYIVNYTIDGDTVELETDEKGTYLTLPSANDCIIGVTGLGSVNYPLYKVTFRTFKSIPTLRLHSLYKGTPQQLILTENDTYTVVPDFQAYYQGRKLKDNIIELPYDAPGVVDVVVDVKDNRYPPVRVKLKVKTSIYTANTKSKLNTALEKGIKTIQFNPNNDVTLSDMVFEDINFINSRKALFENCTFNNVSFIDTDHVVKTLTDKGGNTFNNCLILNLNRWGVYDGQSEYNNVEFKNTIIRGRNCPLLLSYGVVEDCEIYFCMIISDGDVTIVNNNFESTPYQSYPVKDYFPSSLYLTGTYTVKDNTFELSGEWAEPAFNMCVIKTIDGFNPSQFINDNSFDLNIVYDDEPTDTFYYNIVDDDKIYARRLS